MAGPDGGAAGQLSGLPGHRLPPLGPSLAAYEQYRQLFGTDPDFIEADKIRDDGGCVLRYERTFMRPVLPAHPV